MARIRILIKRNINSLTRKIFYRKMPIRIRIVEIYRELLFIVYKRKEKN